MGLYLKTVGHLDIAGRSSKENTATLHQELVNREDLSLVKLSWCQYQQQVGILRYPTARKIGVGHPVVLHQGITEILVIAGSQLGAWDYQCDGLEEPGCQSFETRDQGTPCRFLAQFFGQRNLYRFTAPQHQHREPKRGSIIKPRQLGAESITFIDLATQAASVCLWVSDSDREPAGRLCL